MRSYCYEDTQKANVLSVPNYGKETEIDFNFSTFTGTVHYSKSIPALSF
jgi:hypothetical protein